MAAAHLALVLFVVVIWGLTFVATRWALDDFSPPQLTALRFLVAAAPALVLARPRIPWRTLVPVGLTLFLGQFLLQFFGIALGMPPGLAAVVVQTQALSTILFAALALGERPARHQWIGAAVAFAGLGLIALTVGRDLTVAGLILCGLSAVSWGVGNVLVKRLPPVDMLRPMVWLSVIPPLPSLALSLALDGPYALGSALAARSCLGAMARRLRPLTRRHGGDRRVRARRAVLPGGSVSLRLPRAVHRRRPRGRGGRDRRRHPRTPGRARAAPARGRRRPGRGAGRGRLRRPRRRGDPRADHARRDAGSAALRGRDRARGGARRARRPWGARVRRDGRPAPRGRRRLRGPPPRGSLERAPADARVPALLRVSARATRRPRARASDRGGLRPPLAGDPRRGPPVRRPRAPRRAGGAGRGSSPAPRDQRAPDQSPRPGIRPARSLESGHGRPASRPRAALPRRSGGAGPAARRARRTRRRVPPPRREDPAGPRRLWHRVPGATPGGGGGHRGGPALRPLPRGGAPGRLPLLSQHAPDQRARRHDRRAVRPVRGAAPSLGPRDPPHGSLRANRGRRDRERPAAPAAAAGAGRPPAVAGP